MGFMHRKWTEVYKMRATWRNIVEIQKGKCLIRLIWGTVILMARSLLYSSYNHRVSFFCQWGRHAFGTLITISEKVDRRLASSPPWLSQNHPGLSGRLHRGHHDLAQGLSFSFYRSSPRCWTLIHTKIDSGGPVKFSGSQPCIPRCSWTKTPRNPWSTANDGEFFLIPRRSGDTR